ncbi:MAG: hypothetical protein ACYTGZ_18870 [Planctomycetota bacterium]|jgi:NhaP-type Na+/H+ or K+/H+ antiporter
MKAGLVGRLIAAALVGIPVGLYLKRWSIADIEIYRRLDKEQILAHMDATALTPFESVLMGAMLLVVSLIALEIVGYFLGVMLRRWESQAVDTQPSSSAAEPQPVAQAEAVAHA